MLKRRAIALTISAFIGFGIAMHERPAVGHGAHAAAASVAGIPTR